MIELNQLSDMDFSIDNIVIREEFWAPGTAFDYLERGRSQNLIHIITGGTRLYRVDGGTIRLKNGELLLIPDGTRYYTVGQDVCSGIGICFDLYHADSIVSVRPGVYHDWPDRYGEYLGLIREMNNSASGVRHGNLHIKALLWLLIDKMITDLGNLSEVGRMISPALRYLKRFYRKNDPISVYAGTCGLSESHFRRKFREYTGMSPLEYRDSLRFEEARRLLSDGIPVSQIAEQVGFCDASYFRRLYKKRTGFRFREDPPAEFT
jgi:AraC-like DNA-binding protein